MELSLVVGVDGSGPSVRAVGWAAGEAALRGLPLRLVYASLWERAKARRSRRTSASPPNGGWPRTSWTPPGAGRTAATPA